MSEEPISKIESARAEHAALQEKANDIERIYREATGKTKERHEAVAEALKEHLVQAPQTHAPAYQLADDAAQTHAEEVAAESDESRQIQVLLELAREKGAANAFRVAEKLHNPHLLDAFHDSFIKHHDEFLK